MNVLAITILFSLCLAGLFLFFFLSETLRLNKRSPEQDSLLPFDKETTTLPPDPSDS